MAPLYSNNPPPAVSVKFYVKYQQHDPKTGPYSIDEIKAKVISGPLGRDYLVQREGELEWITIGDLFDSFDASDCSPAIQLPSRRHDDRAPTTQASSPILPRPSLFPACNPATGTQGDCMSKPDEFKTCPFCQQQIRQEAVKCRFCGEWLEREALPDSQSVRHTSHVVADGAAHEKSMSSHQPPESPPIVPVVVRQQASTSDFRIGPILRDVAIIWVLTGLGGFVAGFAAGPSLRPVAAAVSNLLFGTVGFVISGCLATGNRWKHLAYVALLTWFTSLINVLFGLPLEQWFLGVFVFPFLMAIGGGLSFLITRAKHKS
jgi:hypothetical protein